ncbi:MAG: shikimate kinase [Candidatus Cloacimonadota bacterium]|nr:MAG: shikimate kinase [Candidatus Cloacimonadota bacterium]
MTSKSIILIGPMATGKSTIGAALAKITKLPQVPMDRVRWYYYYKHGFSLEKELSIDSFTELLAYWKPFEVNAVQNILKEFPNSIIDFGAGHSYYVDHKQFEQVQSALKDFSNVILLLPCPNKKEALKICNERLKIKKQRDLEENEVLANKDFIEHKSNYKLAKHIVYTKDKTPEETALEIKKLISTPITIV